MAKPFRITGPAKASIGIGRAPNGKFVRLEAATGAELLQMAQDEGVKIDEVLRRERMPDNSQTADAVSSDELGTVHQSNSIPWPPAGPINDADRPPMRLKG
jgi:hypothetical protein